MEQKSNKGFSEIIILVVLVIVAAIVYFWYLNSKPRSTDDIVYQTQEECEEKTGYGCSFAMCDYIPEACEMDQSDGWRPGTQKLKDGPAIENVSDNWKTYRNETLGFELKHPENFIDWKEYGISETLPMTISFHPGDKDAFLSQGLYVTVSNVEDAVNPQKSVEDYVKKQQKLNDQITIKETWIDKQEALKITYGDGNSMELLYTEPDTYRGPIEYISVSNNKRYVIEFHTDKPEVTDTLNQIFSTFQFTDGNFISEAEAQKMVVELDEVKAFLVRVPNGKIALSHEENGNYIFQVFETKDNHTATFNWYGVDKKTSTVTPIFQN